MEIIRSLWLFIQDQLLGMKWLNALIGNLLSLLGMDTTIDHVTDFTQIAAYGVMTTPALMVDGKVVSYGKVLKKEEAKALIQKVRT